MLFSAGFHAPVALPGFAVSGAWVNAAVDLGRAFLHRTVVMLLENLTFTSHGLL